MELMWKQSMVNTKQNDTKQDDTKQDDTKQDYVTTQRAVLAEKNPLGRRT